MMNVESHKNSKFLEIFNYKKCTNCNELLEQININEMCINCVGKYQMDNFNKLNDPVINN